MRSVNRPHSNRRPASRDIMDARSAGQGLTAWDRAHSPPGADPRGTAEPGRRCYSRVMIKPVSNRSSQGLDGIQRLAQISK